MAEEPKHNWINATSVAAVCAAYPDKVSGLMAALDLARPGLEAVKAAVENDDMPAACDALIAYYRDTDTCQWLRIPPVVPGEDRDSEGDALLNDTFPFLGITGTEIRKPNGAINWLSYGDDNDVEWQCCLNRHSYFNTLLRAWQDTGNSIYAEGFDRFIRDWVIHMPVPPEYDHGGPWRAIDTGERMGNSWPEVFYGFQQAEAFTAAGRILMLSSFPEHADYLYKYHQRHHNKAAIELNGLVAVALCFPEFQDSAIWLAHTQEQMQEEMSFQIYPDGVQKELTSSYHRVVLERFQRFVQRLQDAGQAVPPEFAQGIERMYGYLAYAMRPNGTTPLNNDSDIDDYRTRVTDAAETYDRPDWVYIATNGAQGEQPEGLPSHIFPWARQLIMRSGWGQDAHWAFFDAGPWGLSHQHSDKLHLSVHAGGRDLLVDSGRYTYKGGPWRDYFQSSASHNVILVDGIGQNGFDSVSSAPMQGTYSLQPDLDFAVATYKDGFGDQRWKPDGTEYLPGTHTRAVVYLQGKCWVVFDRLETDQPRTISPLWHFHPDCTLAAEGRSVVTTDAEKGNLRIVPVADLDWNVKIVTGQEKPHIQGWYSGDYNNKQASSCAVYSAQIPGAADFAWIILPAPGAVPEATGKLLPAPEGALRVQITTPGADQVEIAVRLSGEGPVELSDGLTLEGRCAVLRPGQPPLVACGRIVDADGQVQAEDPSQ